MARLPIATFDIPVAEIRRGYRSAVYFNRAKEVAASYPAVDAAGVTMQVFQKGESVLCGMDEALAVLRCCTGRWRNLEVAEKLFDLYMEQKFQSRSPVAAQRLEALTRLVDLERLLDDEWINEFDQLEIDALHDGDTISPWETVMHIRGRYSSFAHLESVYLGVLARRTKVATNTRLVCEASNGKPVLFFADRFDHWANQGGDGYAAHIGGATGMATDGMAAWWGERGMGTMPHALIAFFEGNVVSASGAFRKHYPDTSLIALVDFKNDCVRESLDCARTFGDDLWGVRLDTSENMVDRSISPRDMGDFKPTGVNAHLVCNVREALDAEGFKHVKIVVSGGFNPDKIRTFEADGVPVDSYAVGESLLLGSRSFTADIVESIAKMGRRYRPNDRLESFDGSNP